MITALSNATKYDWSDWMIGILRSFVSGGAAALLTGGGGALLNLPQNKTWKLMGFNFLLMGLFRLGEFLTLHGAPDQLQKSLSTAAEAISDAQHQAPPPPPK